ncbi:MAG: lysophospholipid acyltransferase family protein [Verrucomicrobia bacterium]|nr:lysophospholipid acyltransferase family protein [Verrucomicrobiota bacterium]
MPRPAAKSSGLVVPHGVKWHGRLLAGLTYAVIRLTAATLRFRLDDQSGLTASGAKGPLIFSTWHNRLALSLIVYHRYFVQRDPTRCLAALVSASKDGGLLARILEHFGVQPVRGSSSRRGPQALLELTSWAERGYDLAITPDGPRGPRYVVQDGIIALAQLTGLPVVPVAYHLHWKVCLRSWDRFQIPLPLAVCSVTFGSPVHVPKEISEAERESFRVRLEGEMRRITLD